MLNGGNELFAQQTLEGPEVTAGLGSDRTVEPHVKDTLQLLAEFAFEQSAHALSRALDRVSGFLLHPARALLDENFLARGDKFGNFLAQALESRL